MESTAAVGTSLLRPCNFVVRLEHDGDRYSRDTRRRTPGWHACNVIPVALVAAVAWTFTSSSTGAHVEAFTFAWQRRDSKPIAFLNKLNAPSSIHSDWIITGTTNRRRSVPVRPTATGPLAVSFLEEEGEDGDDENGESNEGRTRRRDRIKDFFSTSPSSSAADSRPRVKARFENFFNGMPGVGEILGDGPDTDDNDDISTTETKRKSQKDPEWFEEEKKRIMDSFEEILQDTLAELEAQRREDPEAVPENAEGIVKSVLKQEMDTEIDRMREELSLERLQSYETDQRQSVDEKDISGPVDSDVQRLIDESEQEYSQQEASRLQLEDFLKYEAEAFSQAASDIQTDATVAPPGEDLDQWAMERLEEMAKRRQDVDGAENVLDILDEVTEDLRMRMEKERARKGSVKTETLKEWQMYRAIATKLGRQRETRFEEDSTTSGKADNEEIVRRLDSWKEYVTKEQKLRDKGGLSKTSKKTTDDNAVEYKSDRASRAETRKKINRMSIEALESLMASSDPARRAKLQSEIDFLKAELEGKDYLDFEEPEEDEVVSPVDISNVFQSSTEEKSRPRTAEERRRERTAAGSTDVEGIADTVPPPDTPFFSQSDDSSAATKPPPPNTPFFSDSEVESFEPSATEDSKLGSLEEQKLKSLYRRAGARTQAEQDRIREGWEEYQRIEKEKRKLSGLDETDSEYNLSSNFNVSEVMTDDGDIDAEKILSAIGPRPKRGQTKKSEVSSISLDDLSDDKKSDRGLGKEEVTTSLYRSVSAVGGDRFKEDPEAKARDQAEFEAFLAKESQMRQSLDESADEETTESQALKEDFDDEEYAEDVLSSLGPRPSPRRTSRVDPRDYSDMGGVLSEENPDNEDYEDPPLAEDMNQENSDMPAWLRQENAEARDPKRKRRTFLGDEVEDAFDDDQYDKNMRQLKEYELRRAGKQASLGIDITDVLGRRDIDDYRDYEFDQNAYGSGGRRGWGVASFEDRKRNLVDYTELDLTEVNALMDHRDSVHSTGVSQYTKRINKPFEAFGAVFRLEGVFADLSGIHKQAWTRVAEAEDLRQPTAEEISRASVVRPEVAVQEAMVWTDDFIEAGRIAGIFRATFSDIFDVWAKENDLLESARESLPSATGSMAIGEDLFEQPTAQASVSLPEDEGELLDLLYRAWTQVAFDLSKPVPSREQVQQAAMLAPDIAIQQIFAWSSNAHEVDVLKEKFASVMKRLRGSGSQEEETLSSPVASASPGMASPVAISEATLMEAHFVAWTQVADRFSFDPPSPDEVLGAFVLNDPTIAARDGFGWTEDQGTLAQVVDLFSTELNRALKDLTGASPSLPQVVYSESQTETAAPQSSTTTSYTVMYEEVLEINEKAWKIAAANHGFKAPPHDFVKLSLGLDPEDVIARIFRWTWDGDQINAISETFKGQMRKESEGFATKYQVQLDQAALQIKTEQQRTEEAVSTDELYEAALNAWTATADVHNLPAPTREQVLVAMSVGPEEAIWKGFNWAADSESSWWILETYKEKIESERSRLNLDQADVAQDEGEVAEEPPLITIIPGAYGWIKSLREYEMQCGVISHLARDQVMALLKFTNLNELLDPDVIVSASNGYRSDSQQMLGAALRLERRPDHCVVFDSSPYASVAAHELDMRSVGLIGSFPRYELLSADSTASGFQELTAFNIRRLFGERIFDQPELDRQQADPSQTKKVRTMFDWGDD